MWRSRAADVSASTPRDLAIKTPAEIHCPQVRLDPSECALLAHGGRPQRPDEASLATLVGRGPRSVVLCGPDGEPLALGEARTQAASGALLLCPQTVFPWATRA